MVLRAKTTKELVKTTIRAMVKEVGAARAMVLFGEPKSLRKKKAAAVFGLSSPAPWSDPTILEEVLEQAVSRRRIAFCSDLRNEFELPEDWSHPSVMCVPVRRGPEVIGLLYCDHTVPDFFSRDTRNILVRLAEEFGQRLRQLRPEDLDVERASPSPAKPLKERLADMVDRRRSSRNRLSRRELAMLMSQTSTMMEAGLGLVNSLDVLANTHEGQLGVVAEYLLKRLEEGHSLSAAIRSHPSFDPTMWQTIRAGEESGKLAAILRRLADRLERLERIFMQLRSALTYPAVLMTVSLLMVTGLMWYMVPQFLAILVGLGGELPLPTRILVFMSGPALKTALLLSLPPAIWLLFGDGTREWLLYESPGLGACNRDLVLNTLCTDLDLLLDSGVPLDRALRVVTAPVRCRRFRKSLERIHQSVCEGVCLAEAFEETGVFPGVMIAMIQVGEVTGRRTEALKRAAHLLEQDFETRITRLLSLLEPMILLFLGCLVGFVVLACLLPIYQLVTLQL